MRKILMMLLIVTFGYNGANAGLFKEDVDIADLSQLSAEALESLKDPEFKVIVMRINHAGAKVLEDKAREDLKASKLTLDAKNLRLKSAEADVKAAKATQDQAQINTATEEMRGAKQEAERTKSLVKWKEKEVDVRKTGVAKAKIAISVAEVERDVARVAKLIEQNAPSAKKYKLSEFKNKLDAKQKEYQKAQSAEAKEIAEAKKLKAEYEKQFK